jgi:hypothetical protein
MRKIKDKVRKDPLDTKTIKEENTMDLVNPSQIQVPNHFKQDILPSHLRIKSCSIIHVDTGSQNFHWISYCWIFFVLLIEGWGFFSPFNYHGLENNPQRTHFSLYLLSLHTQFWKTNPSTNISFSNNSNSYHFWSFAVWRVLVVFHHLLI